MDTDGAAADLEAIHDQVVAVAAALERSGFDLVEVLLEHMRERMMLGCVLLLVLVVLEHGEVDDPQKLMTLARHVQALGHVQAQRRENRVGDGGLVGGEQKQVSTPMASFRRA